MSDSEFHFVRAKARLAVSEFSAIARNEPPAAAGWAGEPVYPKSRFVTNESE